MNQKNPDIPQTTDETSPPSPDIAPGEVIIGTLLQIDGRGEPRVEFSGNLSDQPLVAMTTLALTQSHIGRQVALLFANGNLQKPVIMGMIHSPLQAMLESFGQSPTEVEGETGQGELTVDEVLVDGNKITLQAKEKIVLKCGQSSITLTRDGKISIRGKELLNRATGTNRILGGSVQVN